MRSGFLRIKMLLTVMSVLLAVVVAGLSFFVHYQIIQIRKIRFAELNAIGTLKADQINNWMSERVSDADYFSTTEEVKAPLRAFDLHSGKGISNALDTVFRRMKSNHQYEDIFITNSVGEILYTFNHSPRKPGNNLRKSIARALQTGNIEMSDVSFDPIRKQARFGLVAPIRLDRSHDVLLIFTINPAKFLFPLLDTWPIYSRSSESLLVHMKIDSMLVINHLRFKSGIAGQNRFNIMDLGLKPGTNTDDLTSDFEAHDYRGVRVLARVHAIHNTPWFLISKVDKSEVFADLKSRIVLITILAALAMLTLYLYMAYIGDRRTRLAIEESHRLLEETSALAHIGGWTLDPVTFEGTWTAEVARIHELDTTVSPNMNMGFTFYINESRSIVEKAVHDLFTYNKPYDLVLEFRTAKGNHRWIRTTAMPEFKNGKLVRVSGIMQDVTNEKIAELEVKRLTASLEKRVEERTEQLNKSIRELEAFTYTVSHDLRSPLRAIDGFSAILEMDHGTRLDDDARRIITVIRQNAQKMGTLIDELLTFSRLGRAEISKRRISMKEMAENAFNDITSPAEKEKYTFNLQELHPAMADEILIRQVWINLLSNALKFSQYRDHPLIEVFSEGDGEMVTYHIRDNGSGFDMKYYDKLFGVFQRLHSEKEFEGTGVGLAIVHQVVSRHGGRVWAEGKIGEGSLFSFSLPDGENA
jgi:signal transduction histidine kinase